MSINRFLSLLFIPFILFGCAYFPLFGMTQSRAHKELIEKWTPEVRDAFFEMGKASGCFDILKVDGTSCYGSSSHFDKKQDKWITVCEPLCPNEVPECYRTGLMPPLSERCKYVEEWYRKNKTN